MALAVVITALDSAGLHLGLKDQEYNGYSCRVSASMSCFNQLNKSVLIYIPTKSEALKQFTFLLGVPAELLLKTSLQNCQLCISFCIFLKLRDMRPRQVMQDQHNAQSPDIHKRTLLPTQRRKSVME